jgi:hypothetical protein
LEKEDGHRLLEAMEGLKGILEAIESGRRGLSACWR